MQLGELGCASVQLVEMISSPFILLRSNNRSRLTVRSRKIFAARRRSGGQGAPAAANDQKGQVILRRTCVSEVEHGPKRGEEHLIRAGTADRIHRRRQSS